MTQTAALAQDQIPTPPAGTQGPTPMLPVMEEAWHQQQPLDRLTPDPVRDPPPGPIVAVTSVYILYITLKIGSGSGSVYFGRDKREVKQYIRGLVHKQKLKSKRLS